MAGKEDPTHGATSETKEAAQARAEVGGVRSSDDPVPDLWFGQPAEERRDATCSAEMKRSEGRGDGPQGLPAPDKHLRVANRSGAAARVVAQGTRKAGCGKTARPV